ncbi:MAG: DUF2797 domain-containing protein [Acidimicrobiia bacterium]|nr:DUF2797 domain-containing protein [Acidimicrobiia bacterium]
MTALDHRLVVVACSWTDERPRLRVRPPNAASSLVDAAGFRLHYRVDDVPVWHCPGRIPFRSGRGDYIDCLNRPQPDGRKCVDCAVAEATLAGSLHHAHVRSAEELDTAVDKHLRRPNILYLAGFGDGSIKIGTSTAERTAKRLLEQGALLAAVVAKANDGIVVRHIEDQVTERLGIPQSVGVARKLRGLVSPMSADRLAARLDTERERVHDLLDHEAPEGVTPTLEPWVNPDHGRIREEKLFPYPADLRRDAHHLTIDYLVGRLAVVVGRSGDRFVIDLGRIFGLELQPGDFDPVEITVQDSLF